MAHALACDGPGCDTWSKDENEIVVQWITLRMAPTDVNEWHFCCGWCLTKWGAERFEPTEVVE